MTHIEKVMRGQDGVIGMYRAKGMFNGNGELFSEVSIQRTKENPSISGQEERGFLFN